MPHKSTTKYQETISKKKIDCSIVLVRTIYRFVMHIFRRDTKKNDYTHLICDSKTRIIVNTRTTNCGAYVIYLKTTPKGKCYIFYYKTVTTVKYIINMQRYFTFTLYRETCIILISTPGTCLANPNLKGRHVNCNHNGDIHSRKAAIFFVAGIPRITQI
jgi:hypothetical protein